MIVSYCESVSLGVWAWVFFHSFLLCEARGRRVSPEDRLAAKDNQPNRSNCVMRNGHATNDFTMQCYSSDEELFMTPNWHIWDSGSLLTPLYQSRPKKQLQHKI